MGDGRSELAQAAESIRERVADELASTVTEVLAELNEQGLRGAGRLVPRYLGEHTWILQIQLVTINVTLSVEPSPHFLVAYLGMPGTGAARSTVGVDRTELRDTLWAMMRDVVRARP